VVIVDGIVDVDDIDDVDDVDGDGDGEWLTRLTIRSNPN